MSQRLPQNPPPRRAPLRAPGWSALRGAAALAFAVVLPAGPPCLAAAGPATLAVAGRLEAPAGAAPGVVSGARIELIPAELDYDAAKRQLAGDPPAPPLATARAAKDGAFTLQAPGPGCYRVVVSAEGYLPLELLLAPLLEDQELAPARLTPAIALALRAAGPRGEPLPGILLSWRNSLLGAPSPPRQGWELAQRSGRTGADGGLALPAGAGETLLVTAVDPRWFGELQLTEPAATGNASAAKASPQPIRQPPPAPRAPAPGSNSAAGDPAGSHPAGGYPAGGAPRILRLTRQPPLLLEARARDGQPVGGALLRLNDGRPIAIAGNDGRLEVPLAGPWASAWTSPPTLESPGGEMAADVEWAKARGGSLRVSLTPERQLAGLLADAASGQALAGGIVWAERLDGWWDKAAAVPAVARADDGGRFRLRWPVGRGIRLRAAARGYLTARVEAPGGRAPWRIGLDRAVELAGMVVDGAGRPVAGARVAVRAAGFAGESALPAVPLTTDPTGRFRLSALAAGRRYQLTVSASGFASASVLARAPAALPGAAAAGKPAAPPRIVRIVLQAGGTIAGQVVDGAGQALPGIPVMLVQADAIGRSLPLPWLRQWATGDNSWRTASDARGAFELPHLNAGRYRLIAGGPGFAITDRSGLELLPAAARLDLGRIVVEAGAAIEGRVSDPRGSPVPDAVVMFTPSAAGHPLPDQDPPLGAVDAVSAAADGRFSIPDLRRGQRYDLYVRHPEHAPASARGIAAPTSEALRIEIPDGGRLAGRVIDAGGQAVFGAAVALVEVKRDAFLSSGLEGGFPSLATDAQGGFSISGLPAGIFDLTVTMDGRKPARREGIRVSTTRDNPPLEIILEDGSSLAGRVSDTAGNPSRGAIVMAYPPFDRALRHGHFPAQATADGEGRYLIEGLDAGPYTVSVDRLRGKAPTIDLRPGPNQLDLVTEPAPERELAVAGGLVDAASGAPVAGATINLAGSSRGYATSSLSDGSFIFSPVEAGSYRLSALSRGYVSTAYPGSLDLSDAPVEGLELTLQRAEAAISGRLSGVEPEKLWEVHVGATALDATAQSAGVAVGFPPPPVPAALDDTGAYRIAGLAPGAWQVTAVTDSGRSAGGQVTLDPGASEAHLDLDLAAGFTLSGEVSVDQNPIAGASVTATVTGAPQVPSRAQTAADGTFRLPSLRAGTYLLVVVPPALSPIMVPVELAADQEVAVDVSTGGLKGRVVAAATGEPVGGATVSAEPAGDSTLGLFRGQLTAITDDAGAFEIAPLLAGPYRVTATKTDLRPAQATLQVPPHQTAWATLELAATAAPP